MSTLFDLDLRELVGELPATPCEHSRHQMQDDNRHEGDATHYVQVVHSCRKSPRSAGTVYAACSRFVEWLRDGKHAICSLCEDRFDNKEDFIRVVSHVG